MRISDWSSDVCSSDLEAEARTSLRNLPMVSIVYPPRNVTTLAGETFAAGDLDIVSQVISAGSPHLATPLTGAMCLACAAAVPGTVVADIAGDAARGERPLLIGLPSGVLALSPARPGLLQGTQVAVRVRP